MIITVAVAKGGVGKSTLVRALASVATHQGHNVFVIDADERKNVDRWSMLLDRFGNKPENLEIVPITSPTDILALAQEQDKTGKLVIIDTEGKTNDELTAALFAADIAVVPLHLAMDDITAAHQLVNGHIPLVAENRGFPLPVMYVFTNNTVIDKRARALADLREIIQEDGTRIASEEMPYRIAYKDMQTGNTLYSGGRMDPKAIAETEAIFAEIVQYVTEANLSVAAE
ncbi:MAG: ParA family protein [Mesorhizobium sp.]|uniref:ParA family protein n=1 Tax=Mesorhizobium sp. TaxID=1871066 RepID=UPI000FE54305|nr:ParA family protein [Mesorhizobium sp.]RWG47932.1 MAG: ParA family protein [Mesorhizobium sp.]TIR02337.1 MAG: ParA family protein [Mesorhizobium sp.]